MQALVVLVLSAFASGTTSCSRDKVKRDAAFDGYAQEFDNLPEIHPLLNNVRMMMSHGARTAGEIFIKGLPKASTHCPKDECVTIDDLQGPIAVALNLLTLAESFTYADVNTLLKQISETDHSEAARVASMLGDASSWTILDGFRVLWGLDLSLRDHAAPDSLAACWALLELDLLGKPKASWSVATLAGTATPCARELLRAHAGGTFVAFPEEAFKLAQEVFKLAIAMPHSANGHEAAREVLIELGKLLKALLKLKGTETSAEDKRWLDALSRDRLAQLPQDRTFSALLEAVRSERPANNSHADPTDNESRTSVLVQQDQVLQPVASIVAVCLDSAISRGKAAGIETLAEQLALHRNRILAHAESNLYYGFLPFIKPIYGWFESTRLGALEQQLLGVTNTLHDWAEMMRGKEERETTAAPDMWPWEARCKKLHGFWYATV
jgi:hypothetical protein